MAEVVKKGNKITFPSEALSNTDAVVNIKWQQDLQDKQADYILVDTVLAGTKDIVPLFVQKSLSKNFLAKCKTEADECTVEVDGDFQYGQNKEQTFRFLVYHSKSNKAYQHRFINQTTASKITTFAKKITGSVDIPVIKTLNSLISLGQAVFGDPLRDF